MKFKFLACLRDCGGIANQKNMVYCQGAAQKIALIARKAILHNVCTERSQHPMKKTGKLSRKVFIILIVIVSLVAGSLVVKAAYDYVVSYTDKLQAAKLDVRLTPSSPAAHLWAVTDGVYTHTGSAASETYTFVATNHSEVAVRARLVTTGSDPTGVTFSNTNWFNLGIGGSQNLTVTIASSALNPPQ